jgi:hypothetical protein
LRVHEALLRIQVNDHIDFNEAALKGASLIEANSQPFIDAVHAEAQRLAKSQYMKQLNASRGRGGGSESKHSGGAPST